MTTEVEMEAQIVAVLGDLPMPWRSVINATTLDPATVSRVLGRLQLRNQVVLQRDGYVLAPTSGTLPVVMRVSPLSPQKRPQDALESPLGAESPTPRTAPSPTSPRKRGPYKTRKGQTWEKPAEPVATMKSHIDRVIATMEGERDRLTDAIEAMRKL